MVNIRKMELEDIPDSINLEKTHNTHILSEEFLNLDLINDNYYYFVATIDNKIVGYVGISIVLDEADLISIVVDKEYTNQHIASAMMDHIENFAKEKGVKTMTLEVRASNIPAQKLYEKYNYKQISIRKKYYENIEDALIMQKELAN